MANSATRPGIGDAFALAFRYAVFTRARRRLQQRQKPVLIVVDDDENLFDLI